MEARPVYRILTIQPGEPHTGERFTIAHDRPEGANSPETSGQVVYLPGEGLEVSMVCREKNPRAIYHNPNDPVHTDSCMEAFLDCFPELPQYGYIGLEMNANGACHCSFGTSRHTRSYVLKRGLAHPEVAIERFTQDGEDYWRAICLLKTSLLEALYERNCDFLPGHPKRGLAHPEVAIERFTQDGEDYWRAICLLKTSLLEALYERNCEFTPGHRMRGNFYKCGDHTDAPHWASWAPVEKVDFHVPHLFGELIVVSRLENDA